MSRASAALSIARQALDKANSSVMLGSPTAGRANFSRAEDALSNGCIYCTLHSDQLTEMRRLPADGGFRSP
jgi:hypothetical protein